MASIESPTIYLALFATRNVSILTGIAAVLGVVAIWLVNHNRQLGLIPAAGHSGRLLSWIDALSFRTHAVEVVKRAFQKHDHAVFKVSTMRRWVVVISAPTLVLELCRASEDELSAVKAFSDELCLENSLKESLVDCYYHDERVRSRLTRNLQMLHSNLHDEIIASFDDALDVKGNDWIEVPAFERMAYVVARVLNRAFVGVPLCRDTRYINLIMEFAMNTKRSTLLLHLVPRLLQLLASRLYGHGRRIWSLLRYLKPLIEERCLALDGKGSEGPNTTNDLLTWIFEEARDNSNNVLYTTLRIALVNHMFIESISMAFTNALYDLAVHPECVVPLRNEVASTLRLRGHTESAFDKMIKLDSFLKESARIHDLAVFSMTRKAVKPFSFSDGTYIPAGTFVAVASAAVHRDPANYPDPDAFHAFRFSGRRERDGEGTRHQFVTSDPTYLPFGHGRHACPGRFFAASILKGMLVHVLLTYDVMLQDSHAQTPSTFVNGLSVPNFKAKLLFRVREVGALPIPSSKPPGFRN
ncbi:hypothetical protein PLICRDRAFT_174786 [Plicaturopsis crispa FD-325 SS-3]|nr:hypothetical protein PLICRDRAFT_174786 [Plicaturopsis crispa FD-325 SS-3]